LPDLPESEHLILTPAQGHGLAEALPERYRALVYLGAACGPRHGEALGLELGSVDVLRREVHITQQLTVTTGRGPYLAPVKTTTSRQVVELPQVTADALARHIQKHPPVEVLVTGETDPRNIRQRPAELLFTNPRSRPIHRASWSHDWSPAARSMKLPPHTGYHALRHYFASLLIHAGASVKTVQMALGHGTPTVTLDCYAGLWPDQIDRTAPSLMTRSDHSRPSPRRTELCPRCARFW
jgi:integrase